MWVMLRKAEAKLKFRDSASGPPSPLSAFMSPACTVGCPISQEWWRENRKWSYILQVTRMCKVALDPLSHPHLQWMKSGTGLCWLKEAASRFMQISTLSPAMIRTAALFSSSKICLCKEAHRSSMKSSGRTERSLSHLLLIQVSKMQETVPTRDEPLPSS